jgi:RNA recognition motif-containing protein
MTTKLYIGNLPVSATEADLRLKFGAIGTVDSVIITVDTTTGNRGRHGFVGMANEDEARMAINRLNMTQYEDTVMSVSIARVNNVDKLPTRL